MAQKQFQDNNRTRHLPLLLTITGPVPERIPVAAGQELVWRTKPSWRGWVEALRTLGLFLACLLRLRTLCTVHPDNVSTNPSPDTRGGW